MGEKNRIRFADTFGPDECCDHCGTRLDAVVDEYGGLTLSLQQGAHSLGIMLSSRQSDELFELWERRRRGWYEAVRRDGRLNAPAFNDFRRADVGGD